MNPEYELQMTARPQHHPFKDQQSFEHFGEWDFKFFHGVVERLKFRDVRRVVEEDLKQRVEFMEKFRELERDFDKYDQNTVKMFLK